MEELEERKDSGEIIEEMVKYADTAEDKLTVSKISMSFREIHGTEGLCKTPNAYNHRRSEKKVAQYDSYIKSVGVLTEVYCTCNGHLAWAISLTF